MACSWSAGEAAAVTVKVAPVARPEATSVAWIVHVPAEPQALARLAREVLGIDWETVRQQMFPR